MSWNLLYLLDVFALATFAISYYWNCYRRGYRIDFWHTNLMFACVIPNMLMLPFSRSELNYPVLGQDFSAVVFALPKIFLISLVGYFALFGGGFLWRIRSGLGARKLSIRLFNIVPECSMMVMSSTAVLVFQCLFCFMLQALLLSFYFAHNGFGFDLRQYTFANPALRPVALLISGYSIFIASHALARYFDTKEKALLRCTLLLSVGLLFFGARSNILAIFFNVSLCYLIQRRSEINLVKLIGIFGMILLVGLYLGSVRSGEYSLWSFFEVLAALLLYGNNFSDLRDFAWVYALWDKNFWMGKTYLAAVTSFVPRFASTFRDNWGLGARTAITVGFDPHVHPGLRPGIFGESFLNFSIPGVLVVGIIVGFLVRKVDTEVKREFASSHPSMMKAFAYTSMLGIAGVFSVSSNFSGLYVLAGLYLFSWLCLQIAHLLLWRPAAAKAMEL